MKKIFLSCILFLSVCSFSNKSFGGITVGKFNGTPNGYDKIAETHTGNSHNLTCEGPGHNSCTWETKPLIRPMGNTYDVDDVVLDVESYIALGQFTGTYLLDGEIEVSWTALSYDTYEITIDTE